MSGYPSVPVSWGELVDKITILELKTDRLRDAAARANVARELALLRAAARPLWREVEACGLLDPVRRVNAALWAIEDDIRGCEAAGDFGPRFVALARAVYQRNDERAALKRRINLAVGSELIEEKSYGESAGALAAAPAA